MHYHALDRGHSLVREAHQRALVRGDRIHSDAREIVARSREPHCAGDIRRSRLELVRQRVPCGVLVTDERDHVTTRLVWWHRLENLAPADEHPRPHWTEHLVRARRIGI